MSDNFEFKSLSEVEAMEKASDATTVLALDGGQVKQIPANKFGGGGNLIVNATASESMEGIDGADKTFTEMVSAIEAGIIPVVFLPIPALDGVVCFQMAAFNASAIQFVVIMGPTQILTIACQADDTWTIQASE